MSLASEAREIARAARTHDPQKSTPISSRQPGDIYEDVARLAEVVSQLAEFLDK